MGKRGGELSARELAERLRGKPGSVDQPPPEWLHEVLPDLERRWGACGSFLGSKRVGRRWTAEPCLSVLTLAKRDVRRTRDGIQRVPALVRWRDGRCSGSLSTDVIEVEDSITLHAPVFGTADAAATAGGGATVGAVVHRGTGERWLTTAGHLMPGAAVGTPVRVRSGGAILTTTLAEHRMAGTVDYALLRPPPGSPCDNLFQDLLRIGPVFTPTLADRGRRLFVLHGSERATPTVCRGVNGRFTAGGITYVNVIQTDPTTLDGESGGALVDDSMRLWGFVLGTAGRRFSFFAPAELILHVAGVRLV